MTPAFSETSLSAQLCAACGMCCDGVLFHNVQLQSGDSARRLASMGLKLRTKKGVSFFLQPCSFHQETDSQCSCRIYDQRPSRCRAFNCRQLQELSAGRISEEEALTKIHAARTAVAQVNSLIVQIGESNPNRSLAHRVAHALTLPDKKDERTSLHDELEITMKALEALLEKEFRVPA